MGGTLKVKKYETPQVNIEVFTVPEVLTYSNTTDIPDTEF